MGPLFKHYKLTIEGEVLSKKTDWPPQYLVFAIVPLSPLLDQLGQELPLKMCTLCAKDLMSFNPKR